MDEEQTATAIRSREIPRYNLREARARGLVAAVLHEIGPCIDEGQMREVHHRLIELFFHKGVEVLTDHDRELAGLPPRDQDGWTADELRIHEARKLELLLRPLTVTIPA